MMLWSVVEVLLYLSWKYVLERKEWQECKLRTGGTASVYGTFWGAFELLHLESSL